MAENVATSGTGSPVNKAVDPAAPPWLRRVPVVTGVLAALAGFLTVRGQNLSNNAVFNSTVAAIQQEKSSDKWTEYQADSIKKHTSDSVSKMPNLSPDDRAELEKEAKQFAARQPELAAEATRLAADHAAALNNGQALMAEKGLTDYAGMTAQLGIALVSVAALTKKSPLFAIGVLCGAAAVAITGISFLAHVGLWDRMLHAMHLVPSAILSPPCPIPIPPSSIR